MRNEVEKCYEDLNIGGDVFFKKSLINYHCFAHQLNLNNQQLGKIDIIEIVIFIVKLLRSRYHKEKYLSYLKDLNMTILHVYNVTRWLSLSHALNSLFKVYDNTIDYIILKLNDLTKNEKLIEKEKHESFKYNEIVSCKELKDINYSKETKRIIKLKYVLHLMENETWKMRFIFFDDLVNYLSDVNKTLQNNNNSICDTTKIIVRYKNILKIVSQEIINSNYVCFPIFNYTYSNVSNELITYFNNAIVVLYDDITKNNRFSEMNKYGWMYNLVIQPKKHLDKTRMFLTNNLINEIESVGTEDLFTYSYLNFNKNLLSKFITYIQTTETTSTDCEQLFSHLKQFKTNIRNRETVETLFVQLTLYI